MSRKKNRDSTAISLLKSRLVRGTKLKVSESLLYRFRYNTGPSWKEIFDTFGVFSKKEKAFRKYQYILGAACIALNESISKRKIKNQLLEMMELLYE